VIANTDPNPLVNGGGVQELRRAGIEVETGLLSQEAAELNRDFFTYHQKGRPFVHVKIAQSLDGSITSLPGGDRWITGEAARKIVHRLRARYDAVLVGIGTALADDPELTVRLVRGRNPLRVILDSNLRLPLSAKILGLRDREKTLVFCGSGADDDRVTAVGRTGASVLSCPRTPEGGLSLQSVLAALGGQGVRSVLVEGGAGIFTSFLREALWDRLSVFIAPRLLGGGMRAVGGLAEPGGISFQDIAIRRIGDHLLWEANSVYRNS
jgi:diaminohydroxyphosphoribosylaminopyrimidine deaminase/5-amino-6-(5-phosphoribosylamino)uracil reductase